MRPQASPAAPTHTRHLISAGPAAHDAPADLRFGQPPFPRFECCHRPPVLMFPRIQLGLPQWPPSTLGSCTSGAVSCTSVRRCPSGRGRRGNGFCARGVGVLRPMPDFRRRAALGVSATMHASRTKPWGWLQVHDSLACAPPANIRMLAKFDSCAAATPAHPGRRSPSCGTPTFAVADAVAGSPGGRRKSGYSGSRARMDWDGAQRAARAAKMSRGWAGRKNCLDYFLLRAPPAHESITCLCCASRMMEAPVGALGSLEWMADCCCRAPAASCGVDAGALSRPRL